MSNDGDATGKLIRVFRLGDRHVLMHYLYFPVESDARLAAGELHRRGFYTEVRVGADGVNWLVLARQHEAATEDSVTATLRLMRSLARSYAGEYDGWEAGV